MITAGKIALQFCVSICLVFSITSGLLAQNTLFGGPERLVIETAKGKFEFEVEIADTPERRSQGLMFREVMSPDRGMLFDFGETRPVAMWMANTLISLDMIFIKPDGTVLRIQSNTMPLSRDVITSGGPVSHVLELVAGQAAKMTLMPGDRILHRYFQTGE